MKQYILILLLAIIPSGLFAQSLSHKPLVIAHRGASGYAPENTLAAFRKAIELNADALEIDVRQTADSQLVILHDASVNRTTNGKGEVERLSLRYLKSLDAGSWFDKKFKEETIPTLQEVLNILDSTLLLIVEIKENSETYPGIEQRVVDLIRENHLEHRVILKSFDKTVLEYVHRLAPEISLLYVYVFKIPFLNATIDHWLSIGSVMELEAQYLQPHRYFLTKSFVEDAHKNNKKVIAWGVDTEETMEEMISLQVDGIETDYPDILKRLLEK